MEASPSGFKKIILCRMSICKCLKFREIELLNRLSFALYLELCDLNSSYKEVALLIQFIGSIIFTYFGNASQVYHLLFNLCLKSRNLLFENIRIWSRILEDVKTELKVSESSDILKKILNQYKFAFYKLSISIFVDTDSINKFCSFTDNLKINRNIDLLVSNATNSNRSSFLLYSDKADTEFDLILKLLESLGLNEESLQHIENKYYSK